MKKEDWGARSLGVKKPDFGRSGGEFARRPGRGFAGLLVLTGAGARAQGFFSISSIRRRSASSASFERSGYELRSAAGPARRRLCLRCAVGRAAPASGS